MVYSSVTWSDATAPVWQVAHNSVGRASREPRCSYDRHMCGGSAAVGIVGGVIFLSLGFVQACRPTSLMQVYSRLTGINPLMLGPRFIRSTGWLRFTGLIMLLLSALFVAAAIRGLISGCPR